MLNNKLLRLTAISTLLTTTMFGAGGCPGGLCFATIDNLKSFESFEPKEVNIQLIDKSMTIILDGETITVFPKSTYVMTEEEYVSVLANEEANKDLLLLPQSVENIENKILENSNLPVSEYFCEKDTKPLYDEISHFFQCV